MDFFYSYSFLLDSIWDPGNFFGYATLVTVLTFIKLEPQKVFLLTLFVEWFLSMYSLCNTYLLFK